jgi:hypothetical protein
VKPISAVDSRVCVESCEGVVGVYMTARKEFLRQQIAPGKIMASGGHRRAKCPSFTCFRISPAQRVLAFHL